MKSILILLILSIATAHGASETKNGPLQVGNFDPIVSQTATNKIKEYYIPEATKRNNGTLPAGSVTAMWDAIANAGVSPYFEEYPDQLEASAPYIVRANNNEVTTNMYERASRNIGSTDIRALLWETYSLGAAIIFGLLEQETIPKLDLKPISIVGIMEANQDLTFTPEESTSFGGAIAATISVMNLIYKSDPVAFRELYKDFLPAHAKSE